MLTIGNNYNINPLYVKILKETKHSSLEGINDKTYSIRYGWVIIK